MSATSSDEVDERGRDSTDDFMGLAGALHADVSEAHDALQRRDSPYHRRAYTRAVVAAIEALVFALKHDALSHPSAQSLSLGERAMLAEETYSLRDGKPETQTKFIPLEDNLLFAVRMFARRHNSPFALKKGGPEWDAFKRVVRARNRITHPRQGNEIGISDAELADVGKTYQWAVRALLQTILQGAEALHAEIAAKMKRHGLHFDGETPFESCSMTSPPPTSL